MDWSWRRFREPRLPDRPASVRLHATGLIVTTVEPDGDQSEGSAMAPDGADPAREPTGRLEPARPGGLRLAPSLRPTGSAARPVGVGRARRGHAGEPSVDPGLPSASGTITSTPGSFRHRDPRRQVGQRHDEETRKREESDQVLETSGSPGRRWHFLPVPSRAIQQQPDMVQDIAANDPNLRLDQEEATAEGLVEKDEDGVNGLSFRDRAIEGLESISLAGPARPRDATADSGNNVTSEPESMSMGTSAMDAPLSGFRRLARDRGRGRIACIIGRHLGTPRRPP